MLPNPVVITEVTDESEDQFELQNVFQHPVNTTGWFVRIGDSTTAVNSMNAISFSLPPSIPAGADPCFGSRGSRSPLLWRADRLEHDGQPRMDHVV
jgi:hypothetical protein